MDVTFPRPAKGEKGIYPVDVLLATNMISVGVDMSAVRRTTSSLWVGRGEEERRKRTRDLRCWSSIGGNPLLWDAEIREYVAPTAHLQRIKRTGSGKGQGPHRSGRHGLSGASPQSSSRERASAH